MHMCEDEPPLALPMCVQACQQEALIYIEREEEVKKEEVKLDEMEIVFEELVRKHGKKKVMDTFARLSKS